MCVLNDVVFSGKKMNTVDHDEHTSNGIYRGYSVVTSHPQGLYRGYGVVTSHPQGFYRGYTYVTQHESVTLIKTRWVSCNVSVTPIFSVILRSSSIIIIVFLILLFRVHFKHPKHRVK